MEVSASPPDPGKRGPVVSFWASIRSLPPPSSWEPIEKYINGKQYEKF